MFLYIFEPKSKFHAKPKFQIFLGCDDYGSYEIERIFDRTVVNSVRVYVDEESFPGPEYSDSRSNGEENQNWAVEVEGSSNQKVMLIIIVTVIVIHQTQ